MYQVSCFYHKMHDFFTYPPNYHVRQSRAVFRFCFSERKTTDLIKVSQTHKQKYVLFADLNSLDIFMKFRYVSHMRKVKFKNACAIIWTVPVGVRGLKIGLTSLQDDVSEHNYTIGLGSLAQARHVDAISTNISWLTKAVKQRKLRSDSDLRTFCFVPSLVKCFSISPRFDFIAGEKEEGKKRYRMPVLRIIVSLSVFVSPFDVRWRRPFGSDFILSYAQKISTP